jgi:hypothetical protein
MLRHSLGATLKPRAPTNSHITASITETLVASMSKAPVGYPRKHRTAILVRDCGVLLGPSFSFAWISGYSAFFVL